MEVSDIKVGRVYAATRPRDIFGVLDDRQVLWMNIERTRIQYDSPTVRDGRPYPAVDLAKFAKWAHEDVTDKCPKGEWRTKP